MAVLKFKAKDAVWNHHMSVPYHTLEKSKQKSLKGSNEEDNLIIEGDNLLALKALLPQYQGKIKCVYIDPPYNTGNEGWIYNDNVNSPAIKEWLGEAVGKEGEDLVRHDKWLCMMAPRLKLLRELLADDGVIFVSIDDNEQHHLRALLDEIFSERNFIAQVVWEKMYTTKNDATMISDCHEYVMVYAKDSETRPIGLLPRSEEANDRYSNPDNDPRGNWKPIPLYAKEERKNGRYPIKSPKTGKVFGLPPNKHWLYRQEDTEALISDNRIWFGKDGNSLPNVKRFLTEVQQGLKPKTLWNYEDVGTNDSAKKELKVLYGETIPFDFPKPTTLIKRMLQLCTSNNDIVLDCFAGSGTTAQAVLDLNREDGGNRKFILVQLPEEVKENSDASKLGFKWVHEVTRDRVKKFIGSQKMKVGFSYSTLGSSIDSRKILEGKELPSWENFAKYAHYLATGKSIDDAAKDEKTWEIKSGTKKTGVFLIYKDGLEELKNLAITREWLEKVKSDGRRKIVYAPACFLDKEVLDEHNIQFVQIPFNLFIRG